MYNIAGGTACGATAMGCGGMLLLSEVEDRRFNARLGLSLRSAAARTPNLIADNGQVCCK